MAETLASLIDRIEVFLADSTNKSWATGTITECIRYALNDINRAAGKSGASAYTIDDLDSAATTTIPDSDIPALIMGTAAYCAKNRAIDRMEKVALGEGPEKGLSEFGDWANNEFNKDLVAIKKKAFQASASAPNSALEWDEDPHSW